jgi:hypothetical protein
MESEWVTASELASVTPSALGLALASVLATESAKALVWESDSESGLGSEMETEPG